MRSYSMNRNVRLSVRNSVGGNVIFPADIQDKRLNLLCKDFLCHNTDEHPIYSFPGSLVGQATKDISIYRFRDRILFLTNNFFSYFNYTTSIERNGPSHIHYYN